MKGNYLFKRVSRDKVLSLENHMRGHIPEVGRYYPKFKLILERPY